MELLIMSLMDAIKHEPTKSTYAIRIFSSFDVGKIGRYHLIESTFYNRVAEYTFDDVWPSDFRPEGSIMFNEDIGGKVLGSFRRNKDGCESLLVHCGRGINRAPAVGIALNDIFNLGHDSELLKKEYPNSNWYVYNLLKKVA